jgi:hypothetical protein
LKKESPRQSGCGWKTKKPEANLGLEKRRISNYGSACFGVAELNVQVGGLVTVLPAAYVPAAGHPGMLLLESSLI